MDGNKNKDTQNVVTLLEKAIVTLLTVREELQKKPSEEEELRDKIKNRTKKLIRGET
jgi:hypothetical protein